MPKACSVVQCEICYEYISKKGKLNNCTHQFCFDCILKWADTKNTCPKCRRPFTEIQQTRHRLSKRSHTVNKKKLITKVSQSPGKLSLLLEIHQQLTTLLEMLQTQGY